jgi:cytoskeletal protein RodZ
MNKIGKRKNTAVLVFVAMLSLAFCGITMLHAQDPDTSKPTEKAAPKKKARTTKRANTSGTSVATTANSSTAPSSSTATNSSTTAKSTTKGSTKDVSRATKTPVGKETVWVNTATGIYHKKAPAITARPRQVSTCLRMKPYKQVTSALSGIKTYTINRKELSQPYCYIRICI